MAENELFKQLLTKAIYQVKSREQKSISIIHDELAQLLGRTGSVIEHWRKGNIPPYQHLEIITTALVERAHLDKQWLSDILTAADHPAPSPFISKLFPHVAKLNLPTENLPDIAPLPYGSIMELVRNPLFIGRKEDLLKIARLFTDQSNSPTLTSIVSACGMGGMGKTQLASEFVHRYGQFFPGGVFWLDFEEAEGIPNQIAKCGGPGILNLMPNYQDLSQADQLQLVKAAWQKPIPRLLIFDNCEEAQLLEKWRPVSGGCRILVTSRNSDWDPMLGIHAFPLGVLYRHESVSLLRSILNIKSETYMPTLEAIAAEVGDLPLALHMAGRYLHRYRRIIKPEEYLSRLKDPNLLKHPSLISGGISPTKHVQNIWRTFALSYDKLNPAYDSDKYAKEILVRAAHFAPGEPIWLEILLRTFDSDLAEHVLMIKVEEGFARLLELGLIEMDEHDTMRMHRLVAAFVRDIAADEMAEIKRAIQTAVLTETSRINQQGLPLPLLDWEIHLRSVVDLENTPEDLHHARLCNEIGEHFRQMDNLNSARPFFHKSVEILEKINGIDNLETAKCHHNLGWILREYSQFDRAFVYLSYALETRLKHYQKTHPATAESYNEMGRWYLSKGEFDKAETYFSEAKEISLAILEHDHPLTADFLNNLGMCCAFQQKFEEGLALVLEALDIRIKIFGYNHPRTALSMNNAGYIMRDLNQLKEAQGHYENALQIRQTIFGQISTPTAQSFNNLGDLKIQQGEFKAAKADLEKALNIFQTMDNEQHLIAGACYYNLGVVAEHEEELDRAINFTGESLNIRRLHLGDDHKLTIRTRNKLQGLLTKKSEGKK